MLVGVFKSNQGILSIAAVILLAISWSMVAIFDLNTEVANDFSLGYQWVDVLLSLILVSFQAIFLNYIVNDSKLVSENTNLISLMVVLINSASIFSVEFNRVLVANSLILLVFYQLLKLYNVNNKLSILFNSGLLVGIASLVYMPSLVYLLFIWIVLIYMTTPVWRDFALSLIGWALPLVYFVSYYFVFKDLSELALIKSEVVIFSKDILAYHFWQKAFFVLLTGLTLIGIFVLLRISARSIVRVRKMMIVVLLLLVMAFSTLLLNDMDLVASLLMASIPLSIIFGNLFQSIKKTWMAEGLFLALLATIILGYFS